ncbi:DUF4369 domain-containing protein [Flavobacterium litorale]|uniref:DUF4369 domain-containing protein n=1 Tax=Flavobacterium litorale TaxID=2856519 RepID=A0ABX8V3B5_9FLAO|nr:DUF4369 domain-containing protein [Flavobacterium litorale]QYJ67334.1 DUF4369 domain-containing protein [Flavobacterium litorale]
MKKIILLLSLLFILIACKEDKKPDDTNLHITGYIKGLKKGTLYIQHIRDTALISIDTIIINGKSSFESHLQLNSPEMLYLFLDRGQTNSIDNNLPFFAEPGEINIKTTNDDFFEKAIITGSQNHDLYEEFSKIKQRFTNSRLDLIEKSMKAVQDNNKALQDSISEQMNQVTKRHYLFTANYALNNARYEVGPYLALSEIYNAKLKYLDTIQKSMSEEVATSRYGKMLTEYVREIKVKNSDSEK